MVTFDPSLLEMNHQVKCYNSCFDSATQRVMDKQKEVLGLIRKKHPAAVVVYFPMEAKYQVWVGLKEISSMCETRGSAIADAYLKMEKLK